MSLMKKLKLFFFMTLFAALLLSLAAWQFHQIMSSSLRLDEPVSVEFHSGRALLHFIDDLGERALLGEPENVELIKKCVRIYSFIKGSKTVFHAGEYRISPGDSLYDVLARVEKGTVLQHSFTLIEGWNINELRGALARQPALKKIINDMSDSDLMDALGKPGLHPEGWFAPETYFYTKGISDLTLLSRALERQESVLQQAWADKQSGLPYASPYEVLIMASIIEKETGAEFERPEIAGVFVRRLEKGMRLQTDPTVIYGMGQAYDGNITRKDLQRLTPYNTYRIQGLPPTPIAMPGKEAIMAAVNPAPGNTLYFVARGDGTHAFSETLEQHQQYVREYQLQRRQDYRSAPAPSSQ